MGTFMPSIRAWCCGLLQLLTVALLLDVCQANGDGLDHGGGKHAIDGGLAKSSRSTDEPSLSLPILKRRNSFVITSIGTSYITLSIPCTATEIPASLTSSLFTEPVQSLSASTAGASVPGSSTAETRPSSSASTIGASTVGPSSIKTQITSSASTVGAPARGSSNIETQTPSSASTIRASTTGPSSIETQISSSTSVIGAPARGSSSIETQTPSSTSTTSIKPSTAGYSSVVTHIPSSSFSSSVPTKGSSVTNSTSTKKETALSTSAPGAITTSPTGGRIHTNITTVVVSKTVVHWWEPSATTTSTTTASCSSKNGGGAVVVVTETATAVVTQTFDTWETVRVSGGSTPAATPAVRAAAVPRKFRRGTSADDARADAPTVRDASGPSKRVVRIRETVYTSNLRHMASVGVFEIGVGGDEKSIASGHDYDQGGPKGLPSELTIEDPDGGALKIEFTTELFAVNFESRMHGRVRTWTSWTLRDRHDEGAGWCEHVDYKVDSGVMTRKVNCWYTA